VRAGGPGWSAVLGLAAITATLSVVHPVVLVALPLALLLLAAPPRRPALAPAGFLLGVVALVGHARDLLWYASRGWALLLAAWFLLAGLAWPRAPFLPRALVAVAASAASAALVLGSSPGAWARLDWTVGQEIQRAAADVAALASLGLQTGWGRELASAAYRGAALQASLFPALLAVASLAALGIAYWIHRRLAALDPRPLAPLREFRFRDELVWVLVAGLLLFLLPLGDAAARTGSNLLAFMAALYALRGLAVLLALAGSPGPAAILLGGLALLFLHKLAMAATVMVGLSDTWLDLRRRRSAPATRP